MVSPSSLMTASRAVCLGSTGGGGDGGGGEGGWTGGGNGGAVKAKQCYVNIQPTFASTIESTQKYSECAVLC